jgi:hypothetical protein
MHFKPNVMTNSRLLRAFFFVVAALPAASGCGGTSASGQDTREAERDAPATPDTERDAASTPTVDCAALSGDGGRCAPVSTTETGGDTMLTWPCDAPIETGQSAQRDGSPFWNQCVLLCPKWDEVSMPLAYCSSARDACSRVTLHCEYLRL